MAIPLSVKSEASTEEYSVKIHEASSSVVMFQCNVSAKGISVADASRNPVGMVDISNASSTASGKRRHVILRRTASGGSIFSLSSYAVVFVDDEDSTLLQGRKGDSIDSLGAAVMSAEVNKKGEVLQIVDMRDVSNPEEIAQKEAKGDGSKDYLLHVPQGQDAGFVACVALAAQKLR
mmetsp:Transcript_8199/g.19264  ORF Transcript_8199/g.19264 Transcript_8199/m.19264 type:complete len:177 (+) Transcript_8199:269-799(+)